MRHLAAFLLLFPALAETFQGRVVGVHDGDTLTLLARGNVEHKIRLQGIDAPEPGQPYGKASRANLARMAYAKDAKPTAPK